MLVSHRSHSLPMGASRLALDRAIAPTFLLRRATIRELVQDERITKHLLGVDCDRSRHRLGIVLDGAIDDFVDGHHAMRVTAGAAVFVPAGVAYATRAGDCDVLELEWDPGSLDEGAPLSATSFRLAPRALTRVVELASCLRSAGNGARVIPAFLELLAALRAEGSRVVVEAPRANAPASPADQEMMDRVDAVLSQLGTGPMLVDLEASLTAARRTLTRRIRSLHERHALLGRGRGRWRSIRDNYRLVIASILLSHEEATPRRVAGLVGYGSTEALDHAFRHAALPSPVGLRRAVLKGSVRSGRAVDSRSDLDEVRSALERARGDS